MAQVDWNQTEYDKADPEGAMRYTALPAGRYLTLILDCEKKQTKSGTGAYFEFTFDVLAPKEHAGARLWARLNVYNPSETAQRIGREQFNALCAAAGLEKVDKTEKLRNKKVVCNVAIRTYNDKESNEVLGFEPYTGSQSTAKPRDAAPARTATPPATPPADIDEDDIPF